MRALAAFSQTCEPPARNPTASLPGHRLGDSSRADPQGAASRPGRGMPWGEGTAMGEEAVIRFENLSITPQLVESCMDMYARMWIGPLDGILRRACGQFCMGYYLSRTTTGCVARHGDDVVGIALAGGITNGWLPSHPKWANMMRQARERLEAAPWDDRAIPDTLADVDEEQAFADETALSDLGLDAELNLIVVDDGWQGRGIGRNLLRRIGQQGQALGWERMFLITDTSCDWPAYDHLGFTHVDSVRSDYDRRLLRMSYVMTTEHMARL